MSQDEKAPLKTTDSESPIKKRALALTLSLALCGLSALAGAVGTSRGSAPRVTNLRGATSAPQDLPEPTKDFTEWTTSGGLETRYAAWRAPLSGGCDLETCCELGFNGMWPTGPVQCDLLRYGVDEETNRDDFWQKHPDGLKPDVCKEMVDGERDGSTSIYAQPEVFNTQPALFWMIEWGKQCADLETSYCDEGRYYEDPDHKISDTSYPQGGANPYNPFGKGGFLPGIVGGVMEAQAWNRTNSARNNNPECESWARGGECENNPGYMKTSCAKACGVDCAETKNCKELLSLNVAWSYGDPLGSTCSAGRIPFWITNSTWDWGPEAKDAPFELEPTAYIGPADGKVPDEDAVYSACIDFKGSDSGSGRVRLDVAAGRGKWPCPVA